MECRWLRSPTHAVARPCAAPWRSQSNAARGGGGHQPCQRRARRGCSDVREGCGVRQSRADAALAFAFGECSCPVGINCKHVVARTGRGQPAPAWEQTLSSLLAPARPAPHQPADAVALAIELSLFIPQARPERRTAAPASPQLLARLVRSGRTGWVGNGMTWSRLESPYNFGDCCTSHVRLLRELYALHKSRTRTTGYYASDDKMTDLAAFGSRRLWSVLDEAADIGLQIVHARKRLGPVEPYGHAELCLDVTAGAAPGSLVIAPVLRLAGADEPDAMPVLFIGAEGHGVVHVSRRQVQGNPNAAEWQFQLAKLATPAPPPLQRMTLEGQRLPLPDGQQARFRDEFYARLRHLAPVALEGLGLRGDGPEPALLPRARLGGLDTMRFC